VAAAVLHTYDGQIAIGENLMRIVIEDQFAPCYHAALGAGE
jgi:hypothetical protein